MSPTGGFVTRKISSPTPPSNLLNQSDFTYLGSWYVNYSPYAQGLSHRYVSGQLRFLTYALLTTDRPVLFEFTVGAYDGTVGYGTTQTNQWEFPFGYDIGSMGGYHLGLWYDQANDRLFQNAGIDYSGGAFFPAYQWTTQLNSDGTVTTLTTQQLEGLIDRITDGGVVPIPAAFQSLYNTGPYAVGFGGYHSSYAAGVSLGSVLHSIPEPNNYAPTATIPASAIKELANHQNGSVIHDWYRFTGFTNPTQAGFDRGTRLPGVVQNWFDGDLAQGADPRGNPRWGVSGNCDVSGNTVSFTYGPATNGGNPLVYNAAGGGIYDYDRWWTGGWQYKLGGVTYTVPGATFQLFHGGAWHNYTITGRNSESVPQTITLSTSVGSFTNIPFQAPNPLAYIYIPDFTDGNYWCTARPDGGRDSWSFDNYWNGYVWINGTYKQGVVGLFTGCGGQTGYIQAAGYNAYFTHEFHVYDPDILGQVINGSKQSYQVQPTNIWNYPFLGLAPGDQTDSPGPTYSHYAIVGATFDETTKILYCLGSGAGYSNGLFNINRMYAFAVNC